MSETIDREAWKNDKVTIRFHNLERRGEHHTFTVNGEPFHLKHGEVVTVPRTVVSALNDAVKINWKIDGNKNNPPVSYPEKRFLCEIINDVPVEKANDSILKEIIKEKQDEGKPKKSKVMEKLDDLDGDI